MAQLAGLLEKFARPPEEIRAENLRRWVAGVGEATPIAAVQPRQRCRVAGVVQNLRIDPRSSSSSIEAAIIDGSGKLVVKWLGRNSLCGVRLGMGLIVDGTVGLDQGGELMVLNPEYELVPGPEHG
jgi:hypothetical protein